MPETMILYRTLFYCGSRFQAFNKKTLVTSTALLVGQRQFHYEKENKSGKGWWHKAVVGAVGTTFGIAAYYTREESGQAWASFWKKEVQKEVPVSKDTFKEAGDVKDGLPTYAMDEVSQHDTLKKGVWVTYRNGVYDITKYLPKHPGMDKMMMAAGGSVEPFWEMFAIHQRNQEIHDLIEEFRIGNLKVTESSSTELKNSTDPFANEPHRHKLLTPSSTKPYNAEPPLVILKDSFFTPNELFYVRNHLPVPEMDVKDYEIEITGIGIKEKFLTLADIKKFKMHTIVAGLQCGGNRRSEMRATKALKGLNWNGAAIGNAMWSGARLCDVLKAAGFKEDEERILHVQFEGADTDPAGFPYGASIPIEKAMDPHGDVLLVYEMNGQPLSRDHGYPIRVLIPGVIGARSVKWLTRIVVSDTESDSHWQQNDYKGFSPSVDWDTVDFSKSPAIQDMPVTSLICEPSSDDTVKVKNDKVEVSGYAWAGGGRSIIRVDLTADGGQTWYEAKLISQDSARPPRHWGWTLWTAEIPVPCEKREVEIWAKAIDSGYNTQPESFQNIWNLRGLLSHAYHRIKLKLE